VDAHSRPPASIESDYTGFTKGDRIRLWGGSSNNCSELAKVSANIFAVLLLCVTVIAGGIGAFAFKRKRSCLVSGCVLACLWRTGILYPSPTSSMLLQYGLIPTAALLGYLLERLVRSRTTFWIDFPRDMRIVFALILGFLIRGSVIVAIFVSR
jgi:uncharacterized membrane protein (UPF0136 family)